ncbi:MAG: hypothetical protein ACKVQR_04420 [Aquabacterium sp.]
MRIWQTWRERRRLEQDEALARQARAELVHDYKHVFGTQPGERVLADILRRAQVINDPMRPSDRETAYALGMRRLGMEIVEMINADPDAQLAMLRTGETEELYRNV